MREALSAGIPVVASDCVERPAGAITFASENTNDLSEKIISVIDNPYRVAFSQPDFSRDLMRIYLQL